MRRARRRNRRWHREAGWRQAVAALGVAAGLVTSLVANEAQAKDDEKGRPWARGTWGVSPILGFGISRDLIPLTFGVGGSYFIANGLALGLSVQDTVLIYTSSFKSRFPDVENQIPTNSVYVTPTARYVFYRNHRFSPYVFGGLGPVFFNHGGGTRGFWMAGPAVLIGVGGPIYLNLGITFSGIFPTNKCLESFEYTPPDSPGTVVQFDLGCGFGWGPSIGISFAPRGPAPERRRRNDRRDREAREPDPFEEPARNPLGDDDGYEEPSAGAAGSEPGVAPASPPAEAVAPEGPPDQTPTVAPPPAEAPPAEVPPADAPPGDAPPVDEAIDSPPADVPPSDAPPATEPGDAGATDVTSTPPP